MTENITCVRDSLNAEADGELRRIVKNAIEHVLARPDGRRGPYQIDNNQLRSERTARAS